MRDQDLWARCERGYRSLLWRVRPRQLQRGVGLLLEKQRDEVSRERTVSEAYRSVYRRVAQQVLRHFERARQRKSHPTQMRRANSSAVRMHPLHKLLRDRLADDSPPAGPDFHCDAALGGLARWLWAAGYEVRWWPGIDDDKLLGLVMEGSAILLTTDRRLMMRGVIAQGLVPAFLVPIALNKRGQFALIMQRFQLPLKATRCMACGGRLVVTPKEVVRDRIPPRTYTWLSEYYRCGACDKLFWRGTHWQRIESELRLASSGQLPLS